MKIFLTAVVAWIAFVAAASPARAASPAETFVESKANQALQVLNDSSLTLGEKRQQFRELVENVADVPRVTKFVLGRYARSADENEYAAFADVFKEYAIGVYEQRLGEYAGETLQVVGSTERKPGDVIVHTEVRDGTQSKPLPVNWRVQNRDEGWKVVDVQVFGVWLALNQQEEITGVIGRSGGQISAATVELERKIAGRGEG